MTYEEAMQAIRNQRTIVARDSLPEMRITRRFGRPVMLAESPSYFDWTPTRDDMLADDWRIA